MLVILPMHHRSPSVAGTVPTSSGVLAELARPALLGAVIAHPSGAHDVQFHIHGAPEAVSKVTASTAPAALRRMPVTSQFSIMSTPRSSAARA